MNMTSRSPLSYSRLLSQRRRRGDATGAKSTAGAIFNPSIKALAFSEVFGVHLSIGNHAGASETLADAMAAADQAHSFEQADAFCTIAVAQARAGDVPGAAKTLERAKAAANAFTDADRVLSHPHQS